ncbi:non-ribosomal peptide synthetase [Anaerocolumna xylanovorans]|uniref:Amino acid adenylation domain-containing protein n=1 Tax=Anaerocolumna xylanovorans DSM 12503 TaxID=1121345 RepID=A0A1M7YLS8_9FIRM|nr:non-ribosomal peptide synthetase [Anaerocolumna xylanovorans]SHO53570.1 amino acid adenylation domain-containing protein [Anaerocolumna xylanovorans DSM 12503]
MENENITLQIKFKQAVTKYGKSAALHMDQYTLTYEELDYCSDVICNMLREILKDQKEATIAILVSNSFMKFIYMLGVLKAGYTYAPLDYKSAFERNLKILAVANADALLTEERFTDEAEEVIKRGLLIKNEVLIENVSELLKKERREFYSESTQERIAYVIFTSGSSGIPKGVEVQDKAILNFCSSVIHRIGISEKDKTIALSNFGFDASVFDMYPFLLSGAEIYLIKEEDRKDIISLNQYMIKSCITIQCMTTALYHLFLNVENPVLEKLCVIGEKMLFYRKKNYRIFNMYGPTEATVLVTLTEIRQSSSDIPVGYPIDNTDIYIVDKEGNKKSLREKGEICIEGICLAKGYRNNQEENDKHFHEDLITGKRRYYTGDIGMMEEDGNLHCYGRIDSQIKYRGYRIELDEIRKNILQYESIEDAVVLFLEEEVGNFIVTAYCQKQPVDIKQLKIFLEKQLPEYMIPQKWFLMDQFPLNENKKINTQEIRKKFYEKYNMDSLGKSEDKDIEERLKSIWSEVLALEKGKDFRADEEFTVLGGDSLQSLTMLLRVNKEFNTQVLFEEFIENPTIERLVEIVKRRK